MRKRSALIGGGMLVAGILAPTAAHAAVSDSGTLARPPSCVRVYGPPAIKSALLINDCSTTQRVRVIIDWGFDSDCYVLKPGDEEKYDWTFGSYDGLKTC